LKNIASKLAFFIYRNTSVGSLSFEQENMPIEKQFNTHSSNTNPEIYSPISQKNFAKFKNPYDDFFDDSFLHEHIPLI